jgi:hypothetical protein
VTSHNIIGRSTFSNADFERVNTHVNITKLISKLQWRCHVLVQLTFLAVEIILPSHFNWQPTLTVFGRLPKFIQPHFSQYPKMRCIGFRETCCLTFSESSPRAQINRINTINSREFFTSYQISSGITVEL